ncbi:MAG: GNAT family N-acetyltransferase [Lacibacter sp.]
MKWMLRSFQELTPKELYDILSLRNSVFVVEQNCVYLDTDHKDERSFHLWCQSPDAAVVAYCRLLPPGVSYKEASVGRVVVHPDYREKGLGRQLMQEAMLQCSSLFNTDAIVISAQFHLARFYRSLGFREQGAVYLEDGIEHIEMHRSG